VSSIYDGRTRDGGADGGPGAAHFILYTPTHIFSSIRRRGLIADADTGHGAGSLTNHTAEVLAEDCPRGEKAWNSILEAGRRTEW
jgi:hypothetical protein